MQKISITSTSPHKKATWLGDFIRRLWWKKVL